MKFVLCLHNTEAPPIFIFNKFTTTCCVNLTTDEIVQIKKYIKLRNLDICRFRTVQKINEYTHIINFVTIRVNAMRYYTKHIVPEKYLVDFRLFGDYLYDSKIKELCSVDEYFCICKIGRRFLFTTSVTRVKTVYWFVRIMFRLGMIELAKKILYKLYGTKPEEYSKQRWWRF